ncbi:hypothetical protein CMEL01_13967 [Colletotrichum melonis]|uniref:Uncharacterized protein n=1 Tax=Colletotrichum melonis TaxID=1209925 RepID=A0AAI9UQI9_9PEZI|nr:hypothetical protein CMEL01_13967 [Colletotrichum melonis]
MACRVILISDLIRYHTCLGSAFVGYNQRDPPGTLDSPNSGRAHPARWCLANSPRTDNEDDAGRVVDGEPEKRMLCLYVGAVFARATAGIHRRGRGKLLERGVGGTVFPSGFYSPSRPPCEGSTCFGQIRWIVRPKFGGYWLGMREKPGGEGPFLSGQATIDRHVQDCIFVFSFYRDGNWPAILSMGFIVGIRTGSLLLAAERALASSANNSRGRLAVAGA